MRWFALYLPQFHEVAENNEWWGKGFTEWTHVNGAKPLCRGHRQPIKPLNENYYNLMDKETVQWQTQLMKQYGIDGFVYYHYYFQGKKLLEKPAENLLKWKDIDQPFFFCWANHTWYKASNGTKTVLVEQTYGTQKDWQDHFDYLLPFFQDSRYEKKDNKPVFMIFAPEFPEKNEMMQYFDDCCKKAGFDGIYVIETFLNASDPNNFPKFQEQLSRNTQQIYIREPSVSSMIFKRNRGAVASFYERVCHALAKRNLLCWVPRYSGEKLFQVMLKQTPRDKKLCHGLFFTWDNTPRHGVRGYIITPPTKESFFRYADSVRNDAYVFINAWNEWAEGMILEPTTHDAYKYLEWIRQWKDSREN